MGIFITGLAAIAILAVACTDTTKAAAQTQTEATKPPPPGSETLVLGGGCFWCTEAIYEELKGVETVESGYAGGMVANPTYEEVCSGNSGHAEVVKITFNPKEISAKDLLRIFFTVHDPTTLNRQGPDSGTQYRSVIFYSNDKEKALAQEVIDEVTKEKIWPNPIVTTLEPLKNYAKAEDYHQNYFDKYENSSDATRSSMNTGYCSLIIEPKVEKFRHKYADKLKKK
jgi:peptide-methionine (S)-S-oxide reductase